jgi:hypothetical protein
MIENCFPLLTELEKNHRSVLLGLIKNKKEARAIIGFKNGMQQLAEAMAESLKNNIELGCHLTLMQKSRGGWQVAWRNTRGEEHGGWAKNLIITIPHWQWSSALPFEIIKDLEGDINSRREFTQAGAEILGSSDVHSIKKILFLMDGLCNHLAIPHPITLVLGNITIVMSLLGSMGYPIESISKIIPLIYSKNKKELWSILSDYTDKPDLKEILFKLFLSFDFLDIFTDLKLLNQKYNLRISEIIDDSEQLLNYSNNNLKNISLCMDYTLFRDLDYYTGFIFQGYGMGSSYPIFTGGAYDKLFEKFTGQEKKACGFALNIDIFEDIIGN